MQGKERNALPNAEFHIKGSRGGLPAHLSDRVHVVCIKGHAQVRLPVLKLPGLVAALGLATVADACRQQQAVVNALVLS